MAYRHKNRQTPKYLPDIVLSNDYSFTPPSATPAMMNFDRMM